jgi:hypothetical protein
MLVVNVLGAQDQKSGFWSGWSVNINGGANLFYGDTDNYRFYRCFKNNSEWRFAYGLMLQKEVAPWITIRGQLLNGDLSGTKRKDTIWFETKILETSLSAKIDLSTLVWGAKKRTVSVYAMGGIGFAHWETSQKCNATDVELNCNGKNNTGSGLFGRTLEPVIPFGVGVDFRLNDHWDINVEGTLRPVRSDKLDANEGGFPFDFYSYNFVGVTYNFGRIKSQEPEMPPKDLFAEEQIPEPELTEKTFVVEEPEKEDQFKKLESKIMKAESETGLYESPWPGVKFSVQIAAARKSIDIDKLASKYQLNGKITEHFEDGWYRYTLGSYIKYWKAREYKNLMVSRNLIYDAFVVAYRDDKRLTMGELIGIEMGEQDLIVENQRPVMPVAYSVQIMASVKGGASSQVIKELYEISTDVYKEFSDGWFHYSVGNFESYTDAAKLRNSLKLRGLKDAFIVGYKNGKRVDLSDID